MSKGTPSFGKNQKKTHVVCRRCGKASLNTHTKCAQHVVSVGLHI